MLKKIIFIYFFFTLLICENNFKTEVFNKYSIQKIDCQSSDYSLSLTKSNSGPINYYFSWLPTSNFIINTKLINNFKNDNKLFYSFNFGLLLTKNNIFGISSHSLKFDNLYNDVKWNSYFIINKTKIYNWRLNTNLSYNFNKDFSFINISNFFETNFFRYFNIGVGCNFTKMDTFIIQPYFGVQYKL